MKKQKFRYNPETLSYDKVELSWKEHLLRALLVVAPAVVLGFGFYLLFSSFLVSANEQALERENVELNKQIRNINEELLLIAAVVEDLEKRDNEIYRVVFNAEPFPEHMRELGTGGSEEFEEIKGYDHSERVIENKKLIQALEKRIYAQSISFDEVIKLAKEKEQMLAAIPAIQPISNVELTRISSGYGWRIDPIYKTKKMHWGLDFTAETGSNVYSTGNGVVKDIEEKLWGYGNCIIIDHGFGYVSRYAHLSGFKVKKGDKVVRGQLIGLVGSSGKSTAPHLHYEIEKNGKKIDPVHFFHSDISGDEYERLLEMANNANQSFD
ncbi:MAG: peptidoglycan DD-metalloendopeptidase family protein [Crocinitomix sp.]|nr:peptidoglycan DD-metalloendopeptidase family protein [Crocinitomix sp.]